jgi:TolB-like protein
VASIGRILGELKQRNVIRVAGVYAVTTWGVFQIANNLFPALNMPKWTVTLVAVLMLIGFPVAMVIAWAFEKGPDGIRRTVAAEGPKPRFVLTDWLLLAALLAIVGVTTAQMAGVFGSARVISVAAAPPAPAATSAKSIAVLPFVSFSEGQDAQFFADGLTEEVINSLANIPELKVAGRTSSFYFKDKNQPLREIGAKLGVAYVLEGSVRRDGERIRITGQLIKVSDGFHLWSQTYDRDF